MVDRSLLQPGVFSTTALEQIMQTHPDEFLCEGSTANVGMRMKCEYNIRRGLRLAGDIKLTDQALKQHQAAYQSQLEEENASMDESDSNPSVDNIPVAKMLKSVKKLNDISNLVGALKKAAVRKKKKELELVRKLEKKEARKQAMQKSEAKRITEEAEQEKAAQAAKEAAALAAAQANAKAQQAAEAVAEEMREKVAARRKSSIFQSAPKHAPMYRLAPDDAKQAQQLLPMKIVNFKDHDHTQGPQFHHGASAVDPPVRARSNTDLAYGDSSPHNLTLSMASLTSAVNKLYFQPVGEIPDALAVAPPVSVSAASNASALLSSTRRNSLHNSFINPAAVVNAQAGFEMPPAWEFSPRGAALRPIVHNMAPLLPASAASGEISQRERERLTVSSGFDRNTSAGVADRATTQQLRPKSSSATSKRKIY
jgi:chemotaxis protein histidine kinase CheA